MFEGLGKAWNKALDWYLTTDFFPYDEGIDTPAPFDKMDERSLGDEMVSAFNRAEPDIQEEFVQKIPQMLAYDPSLVDALFRVAIGIVNKDTVSSLTESAIEVLPACLETNPDLIDSIPLYRIWEKVDMLDKKAAEEKAERPYMKIYDNSPARDAYERIDRICKAHISKQKNTDLLAFMEKNAPKNGS
jgi:hypothetical protein